MSVAVVGVTWAMKAKAASMSIMAGKAVTRSAIRMRKVSGQPL